MTHAVADSENGIIDIRAPGYNKRFELLKEAAQKVPSWACSGSQEFIEKTTAGAAIKEAAKRCYGASGEDNGTIVAPANQRSAPCHS